jgi:tripartite-type tricarboxylate transporter receptor subunit TctC
MYPVPQIARFRALFSARPLAALAALLPVLIASPAAAQADAFPNRPVRIIVSFAPGAAPDIIARLFQGPLARELGQPVVIENRPGASGFLGGEACARAAPDGYTLCLGSATTHGLATLVQQAPYDPIGDFTPITVLGFQGSILAANAALGLRSFDDFAAWARTRPGAAFGTNGIGSSNHLMGEALSGRFNLGLVHVPYRGGNLAQQDVIAGHIPLVVDQITGMLPHIQSGRLVPLLMLGARTRAPQIPHVPLATEGYLPEFRAVNYTAILGPARLPEAVLGRLNAAVRVAGQNPDVRNRMTEMGSELGLGTPAETLSTMQEALTSYRAILSTSGIRLN